MLVCGRGAMSCKQERKMAGREEGGNAGTLNKKQALRACCEATAGGGSGV